MEGKGVLFKRFADVGAEPVGLSLSRDGKQLFVGVVTERQWEIFTKRLGEPALLDSAYATNNDRSRARETLGWRPVHPDYRSGYGSLLSR